MAKLNGVKTLDMVNGEITKVAYNGEEYAKVEGKAEVGDLILANENLNDVNEGDFFETFAVGDYVKFYDNNGDCRDANYGFNYSFFRKISASTPPTIEKRVDDLELRVSALEGGKAETNRLTIGDIAKVVNKQYDHNAKVGDIVKIVDDEKDIQPYLCEFLDGSNAGWFGEEELIRYNDADIIEFEGEKYRKVDREAREGDVIILSQKQADKTTFVTAGTPYKVFVCGNTVAFVNDRGHTYDVYYQGFGRTPETVDVYEPIAASKPKYEPKVGDIVKIVSNTTFSENKIGDIGKVDKVGSNRFTVEVPNGPNTNIWTELHDIRPATAEEIAQYEKAVAKSKLKAGDYVVFTDAKAFDDYFTANKPYKVRAGDLGDLYIFNDEDMADYGALDDYDYEIVEGESLKWAKLGRKVNEYKKGDIVRIIKATIGKNDGEYGKVEDVSSNSIGVRLGNRDYRGVYFDEGNIAQLIAPVESVLTHN